MLQCEAYSQKSDKIKVSPELIYFLSTFLCIVSLMNLLTLKMTKRPFDCELQAEISQTLAQSKQPEAIKVLRLASYRPLHQYDWCQKLEALANLEEGREGQ